MSGHLQHGAAALRPRLVVRNLDTPPGDDTLSFTGRVVVPHPFAPALDPTAVGVGIVVADATGARVLDVVPGGMFDPVTGVGWTVARNGTRWTWVDASATPRAGITRVSIGDRSRQLPGLLQIAVTGRRGSYAVDPGRLPLGGLLILDPPTAETGRCGQASFTAPGQACTTNGKTVRCR